MDKRTETLSALIQPTITLMGYEFIGLEFFSQGHYTLVRIYVDREGGITVDDCSRISQQISALLDVENPITNSYSLEVSSPGIERPLFSIEQFKKCLGKTVVVRLKTPIDGQRNMKGEVKAIQDQVVVLQCNDKVITVPFESISKANQVAEDLLGKGKK